MATNYLGHFALTLGLLPILKTSSDARVVTLSAIAAYDYTIDFENLQSEKTYKPMATYSQSKLAELMFANELGKKEPGIISVRVHPGIGKTNLQRHFPAPLRALFSLSSNFMGQSAESLALPSLYAATGADVKSGTFYGPTGKSNKRSAGAVKMPEKAENSTLCEKLWIESERLTGIHYDTV